MRCTIYLGFFPWALERGTRDAYPRVSLPLPVFLCLHLVDPREELGRGGP